MHLRSAHVQHVKGLTDVLVDFGKDPLPGWHVILGDNSTGKTTLVRALALGFVGPIEAMALREDWTRWVEHGCAAASVKLDLVFDGRTDVATGTGRKPKDGKVSAQVNIVTMALPNQGSGAASQARLEGTGGTPFRYVWGTNPGWFSASFGPSRRFTGGSGDYHRVFFSNPRVARHLSGFSEQVALSEALMWLVERKRAGLYSHVERVTKFINSSGLLPHSVVLDQVTDQTLRFQDGNGVGIDVTELSDGYRSILSLALELLRQMEVCFGFEALFDTDRWVVGIPGVVIIDEIDSHLHPSWQATVGEWFTSHFPNIQFMVATHSALVCRSIGKTGRVFRLRAPGADGPQLAQIVGEERDKLWFGSLQRALGSEGFGLTLGRSEFGRERVKEMGSLEKAAGIRDLSPGERQRLQLLRAVLADAGRE